MRKAILSVIMVCALAGVAMAVPTGPGGTFFWMDLASSGNAAGAAYFYYNVDSNWDLVDIAGAPVAKSAAVVARTLITPTWRDASDVHVLPDATTGLLDMNGVYTNANLLRYDSGTGTSSTNKYNRMLGADGATLTTLTTTIVSGGSGVVVGSKFTPNGETWGIFNSGTAGTKNAEIWTEATPGSYSFNTWTSVGLDGAATNYSATVGAVVRVNGNGFQAIYKDRLGPGTGYTQVDMAGTFVDTNCREIAADDVDGDGRLDVYYADYTTYKVMHAADLDGDGSWTGGGEQWEVDPGAGSISGRLAGSYQLLQVSTDTTGGYDGGHWVLMMMANSYSGVKDTRVYELDKDGDIALDSGGNAIVKTILATSENTTYANFYSIGAKYKVAFAPLNAAVPEPTTMLLVGTGILGLAGVVRRRFLG